MQKKITLINSSSFFRFGGFYLVGCFCPTCCSCPTSILNTIEPISFKKVLKFNFVAC